MSIRKPFSTELFNENDEKARNAVMQAINDDDLYVRNNDDKYGPDLCVYRGYKHKFYIEVEIKHTWKDGTKPFPFPTVQVAARKLKYSKSTTKLVEFWLLSSDLKSAVIILDNVLESSPIQVVPNKYEPEGEEFVQVPIEHCTLRRLV